MNPRKKKKDEKKEKKEKKEEKEEKEEKDEKEVKEEEDGGLKNLYMKRKIKKLFKAIKEDDIEWFLNQNEKIKIEDVEDEDEEGNTPLYLAVTL